MTQRASAISRDDLVEALPGGEARIPPDGETLALEQSDERHNPRAVLALVTKEDVGHVQPELLALDAAD